MNHLAYIALIITGLHVCTWEGMLLSPVRVWAANAIDKAIGVKWSRYVQKPLWDCLPCMASVWGIVLLWTINPLHLLALCGLLKLMETLIATEEDAAGEQ